MIQRYKNDAAKRKRLFVAEAFAHPAKGHISLWEEMVLRYSKEGDTILDPMAGIGTTLVAALMGRNVICVELEPHFVEPMRRSWEKMRQHPMLGYSLGEVLIVQGDARDLSAVLGLKHPALEQNPDLALDAILSSPPYENSLSDGHLKERTDDSQMGYTRPVDAIVSSLPYEGSITGNTSEATRKRIAAGKYHGLRPDVFTSKGNVAGSRYGDGYTRPPQVDATTNIGNLKNAAYWDAIRQVYAGCWRILRPGGIMALVLKGFTRDGQYVDLPGQTEALLLAAGWQKHDHFRRELWSLSFWRILQRRRDPQAFDERLKFEEVLAFRKPGG